MKQTLTWAIVLLTAGPVWAAGASHWTHTSEADFKKGVFRNVVATNLGDLKLSRATKTLLEQDPRVSAVYALVEDAEGTVYAGTGPQGIVLQLKGEKVGTIATLEDVNVFSLLMDKDGKLLVGTGGEHGRILRLDPKQPKDKPVEVFKDEKVQYVWKMVRTDDGMLYAATGPEGKIFEIGADGKKSVLLDSKESNILSLIGDGKDLLYAGTDPNGLVYRINRKTKDVFVLYDAPETEISGLVLDGKGNLYAATGQAGEGDDLAGDESGGETEKSGRPEAGEGVAPLPSQKPSDPKPPGKTETDESDAIPRGAGLTGALFGSGTVRLLWVSEANGGAQRLWAEDGDEPVQGNPGEQPQPPVPPGLKGPATVSVPAAARRPMPIIGGGAIAAEGNAIYRIEPGGFVTEVFRQPVMVMSLIEKDGVLLVGTGNDGLVYQVNLAAEETAAVAKVDPKQVMCLLLAKDGRLLMGLANVGGLGSMSSGFSPDGTYTSAVLDATQISRFGKIHLQGALPAGTKLTMATRSGNVREPDEAGWSKWSQESAAAEYMQIGSPAARFLQYRLTFTSQPSGTTPVVDEVDVAYQMPNLGPQVKAVKISPLPEIEGGRPMMVMPMHPAMMNPQPVGKPPVAGRMRLVTWEASDADNDSLEYSLYVRYGPRGRWILLQEKLKEPQHLWDTRGMADGRYWLKVVASDARANPRGEGKESSRVSDPVVVDNTPPVIGDVKVTKVDGGVKIEARIVDRTGIVCLVEYAVDSKDEWQAVIASDKMFDSPEEGVSFTVGALAAGSHQVTLRASDDHGNQAYEAIPVVIDAAPQKQ